MCNCNFPLSLLFSCDFGVYDRQPYLHSVKCYLVIV
jgi:hypothetical protein